MKNIFVILIILCGCNELKHTENANYQTALIKLQAKDYTGTILECTKSIEQDCNSAKAYKLRGMAKDILEDYRGAILDYSKAIELKSNLTQEELASAYFLRGLDKDFLNDKNGACLDWSKAGELGDKSAYSYIKQYCQ